MKSSRPFFLLLLALAFVALCFLVKPLAPVLLFAAVLASTLTPLYDKLVPKLRGHRQAAAIVFVVGFFVIVLAPIIAATASAANDVVVFGQSLSEQLDAGGVDGLVHKLPPWAQERVSALDVDSMAVRQKLGEASGKVLAAVGAF